ncbi:hypothetical protein DER44DRAFT_481084 [Fusarium oxysporum]|nr:hypothetical protein DER44DRAFT_481084 [Fusarium oxysporum]
MRKSSQTCRFQGLGPDITDESLNEFATKLCAKSKLRNSVISSVNSAGRTIGLQKGDKQPSILGTSLTTLHNTRTATITFGSDSKKQRAIQCFQSSPECTKLDDEFEGLTVLYGGNGEHIDIDICAVHGMDGHAFDTWMAPTKMWLRDHLPSEFPKSRIMTFGYNSNSMDGKSINHGLSDFADTLIDNLKYVRTSDEEQCRPVLLICHSMGGLVGRLAVTRHWRWQGEGMKYASTKFGHYGLLFLSTPHFGSDMANFSDFVLDFASSIAGVRKKLVEELKTFNPSLQEVIDDWKTIKPQPIFCCLCETDLTQTLVGDRQIVTPISAGFMGTTASPVSGTDHKSVCRFETKFDKGWAKVLDSLREIRRELLEQSMEVVEHATNAYVPGRTPISAPSFPPQGKHFFYNEILRQPSEGFVGRAKLLKDIRTCLNDNRRISRIALTGMAGAGKTEILLHLAEEYRSSRNVFLFPSSTDKELREAVQGVAIMMGNDLMEGGPQPQRWNSLKPEIQERMFMKWIERSQAFSPCIIMFDDLNHLDDERHRANVALKDTTVLISTRDPVETKKMGFEVKPVSTLDLDDMICLFRSRAIKAGLQSVSDNQYDQHLKLLAESLELHAFGACAASTYLSYLRHAEPLLSDERLLRHFFAGLEGSGTEAYECLLRVKLSEHGSRSIMRLCEDSLRRLEGCVPWRDLLELMVFTQPAPFFPNAQQNLHIFDFLAKVNGQFGNIATRFPRPILADTLKKEPGEIGEILHAFEKASLGIRVDRVTLIPTLWRACVIQACEEGRRESWLQQIIYLSHHVNQAVGCEEDGSLIPYATNCIHIAKRFNVSQERLLVAAQDQ